MPSRELSKTSEPPVSSTNWTVREALVIYAEVFRDRDGLPRKITTALIGIYERALADIPAEQLQVALEAALKTYKFFPTPAEIRGLIDRAEELDLESEAEDAWQGLLHSITRDYIPDVGRSPHLAWDVEHAARAAGGLTYLERCPHSELVWARKRFIEDFLRIRKSGQAEHLLLSQRGFQRLLTQVSEVSSKSPKPLSAAPERPLPPRRETAKAARAAVDKTIRPMPAPPSEEEIARRKAEQKQRLGDWLRTRAQPASTEVSKG